MKRIPARVWEVVLFGLLFLPNVAALFLSSALKDSWFIKGAYLFFVVVLWLLPFLCLKTRVAFLLGGVLVLISPVEVAHLYYMGVSATPAMLRTILMTNWGEASELMGHMGVWIMGYVLYCALYFYGVSQVPNRTLFPRRIRWILIGTFLIFNVLLYVVMWRGVAGGPFSVKMEMATDRYFKKYYKVYPFSFIYAVDRVVKGQIKTKAFSEELHNFRFHVRKEESPQRRIVVWVMGESSRYDHYSVNGYPRMTSPRLSTIPGLLSYTQMYSEANLTEPSLSLFLTRATPQNRDVALREKSIVDLFAEAGFRTAWIANQSAENLFVSRIAKDADYSYFTTADFDANENYDGNLVPKVEEQLQKEGDLFILVHLLGSHFRYNYRYPKTFERFTPCLEGAEPYSILKRENKQLLVNTYDNTILYTDYVLSRLIRVVECQKAASVVLFTSDHGEALYDDANTPGGHANVPPSLPELHVPLFVWTSLAYNEIYPNKRRAMEDHREASLNSSNLFYSVADMVGLRYRGDQPRKSFASGAFVPDSVSFVLTVDERIVPLPLPLK